MVLLKADENEDVHDELLRTLEGLSIGRKEARDDGDEEKTEDADSVATTLDALKLEDLKERSPFNRSRDEQAAAKSESELRRTLGGKIDKNARKGREGAAEDDDDRLIEGVLRLSDSQLIDMATSQDFHDFLKEELETTATAAPKERRESTDSAYASGESTPVNSPAEQADVRKTFKQSLDARAKAEEWVAAVMMEEEELFCSPLHEILRAREKFWREAMYARLEAMRRRNQRKLQEVFDAETIASIVSLLGRREDAEALLYFKEMVDA